MDDHQIQMLESLTTVCRSLLGKFLSESEINRLPVNQFAFGSLLSAHDQYSSKTISKPLIIIFSRDLSTHQAIEFVLRIEANDEAFHKQHEEWKHSAARLPYASLLYSTPECRRSHWLSPFLQVLPSSCCRDKLKRPLLFAVRNLNKVVQVSTKPFWLLKGFKT